MISRDISLLYRIFLIGFNFAGRAFRTSSVNTYTHNIIIYYTCNLFCIKYIISCHIIYYTHAWDVGVLDIAGVIHTYSKYVLCRGCAARRQRAKRGNKKKLTYMPTTHIVMFRSRWFATPSGEKYCIPAVRTLYTCVCLFCPIKCVSLYIG